MGSAVSGPPVPAPSLDEMMKKRPGVPAASAFVELAVPGGVECIGFPDGVSRVAACDSLGVLALGTTRGDVHILFDNGRSALLSTAESVCGCYFCVFLCGLAGSTGSLGSCLQLGRRDDVFRG